MNTKFDLHFLSKIFKDFKNTFESNIQIFKEFIGLQNRKEPQSGYYKFFKIHFYVRIYFLSFLSFFFWFLAQEFKFL